MSSNKTCATCRFMAAPRGEYADDGGYDLGYFDGENYVDAVAPHGTCVRIIHGNLSENRREAVSAPAFVVDGSGYAARLLVLPTFGCNLHEPKEA